MVNNILVKILTDGLHELFSLRACIDNTFHGVEIHWLSGKENILGKQSVKLMLTVFMDRSSPFTIDFFKKKGGDCKQ